MADRLTPAQRQKNMRHIKNKDSKIELTLRKALWTHGYRYRKNYTALPGKPDIVLTKYKIAIFCDSEFFHGKDWDKLKAELERGSHPDFWIPKISSNLERDKKVNCELTELGWMVLRFWGKDILKNTDACVKAVDEAVSDRKQQQMGG